MKSDRVRSASIVKQPNPSVVAPSGHAPTFSRLVSPELCQDLRPSEQREGAGKAGYRLIPAAPVRIKMHGAGTTGSAGNTRPSLRDGLTAYSALSPGTGLFCPRHSQSAHCALWEFSASVGAPGPHGLAVRESLMREQRDRVGTSPIAIPAKTDQLVRRRQKRQRAVAATASRLHVRDDRETPLFMRRDARKSAGDLGSAQSGIFFARRLDRGDRIERAGEISF